MARDLKGIIRLRKREVDEKRRMLADLLDHEARLIDMRRQLDEEMKAEAVAAGQHVREAGLTYGGYVRLAIERRDQVETAIEQMRGAIAAQQDVLNESFKELKTVEVAQETREEEERLEAARKEQDILDEIGLNIHRRQG